MRDVKDFLGHVVKQHDLLLLCKIDAIVILLPRFSQFKVKLHRYLAKNGISSNDNSMLKFKQPFLLKHKKLIWKLFIHYQIFAANNRQQLVVIG
jgi:hypothetical protein